MLLNSRHDREHYNEAFVDDECLIVEIIKFQ